MPAITATFRADLTQFERALAGAETKVSAFERSTAQVNRELAKFGNEFSGANLQRQALTMARAVEDLGGATRLTATEQQRLSATVDEALDKYRALGQAVPPSLVKISAELANIREEQERVARGARILEEEQRKATTAAGVFRTSISGLGAALAGAFTVGSITAFAKAIIDLGGEISDLARQTGLSTDAVQEFKFAADQTGSSIDAIAASVSRLNKGLVEGDRGTARALEVLNLSFAELRALRPEDAFTRVAEAIRDVPDPMRQSHLALQLFGRAGAELLPAIKAGFQDLRDEANRLGVVLSEDSVEALDEFGDKLDATLLKAKVGIAELVLGIPDAFKAIRQSFSDLGTSFRTLVGGFGEALENLGRGNFAANFSRGFAAEVGRNFAEATRRVQEFKQLLDDAQLRAEPRSRLSDLALGIEPPVSQGGRTFEFITEEELKRQEELARRYAEEIQKIIDDATGAAAQAEVKKLQDAFRRLSQDQKTNADVVRRLLEPYEELRQQINNLPRELERARAEFQKPLRSRDLSTDFGIVGLPPDFSRHAEEIRNRLDGLRRDGLLPVSREFKTLAVDVDGVTRSFYGVTTAIDTSYVRSQLLTAQMMDLDGQLREAQRAAAEFNSEMADLGAGVADAIGRALLSGEGITGALEGLGDVFASTINQSIQKGIQEGIKSGTMTGTQAFLQGAAGAGIGLFASAWVDALIDAINADENERRAQEAGAALSAQFIAGFGGPQAFRQIAEAAGATREQIARVMSQLTDPQAVQEAIASITPLLARFQQEMAGLGTAGTGTIGLSDALFKQFENVEALTAENIDRINNLGLITGGVIANTVGRTGDLVSAIQAVGPALENLDKLRDKFNLTDALSPATQQVLGLYDAIKQNEGAFSAISNIGQIMEGLGAAMIANTPLANAFGQELAAQIEILKNSGVDASLAFAAAAPQLQQLYELSRNGRITIDETTAALLKEAEAHGVVGETMRNVNDQILDVLTEIRDLFSEYLPTAVALTTDAFEDFGRRGSNAIRHPRAEADSFTNALNDIPESADQAADRLERTGSAAKEAFQRAKEQGVVPAMGSIEEFIAAAGPGIEIATRRAKDAIVDEHLAAEVRLQEQIDLWEALGREMQLTAQDAEHAGRVLREKIPRELPVDIKLRFPDGLPGDYGDRQNDPNRARPGVPGAAHGAIVLARPGGTIVRVGEAGQDEAIIPLPGRATGRAAAASIVFQSGAIVVNGTADRAFAEQLGDVLVQRINEGGAFRTRWHNAMRRG
jgi:predicted  nucleic acid-binding Zn-ribbon protein